jgi:MtN3 and saliva related transmembrane protein
MTYFFEIIGYLAGICTATCFLPQTIKTIRSKNVKGLSSLSYLIYNLGILCWIIYGFHLGSTQMIVFNAISIVFAGTILYMIVKFRRKRAKKNAGAKKA